VNGVDRGIEFSGSVHWFVGSEVLMAVAVESPVFWDVMPCSLVY
jgi:hypothetical protein